MLSNLRDSIKILEIIFHQHSRILHLKVISFYFQTTLLLPDSAESWPLLAEEFTSFDLSYFEEEDNRERQRTNVQLEVPLVQVTNDINMEIPLQMFGVVDIFQVSNTVHWCKTKVISVIFKYVLQD